MKNPESKIKDFYQELLVKKPDDVANIETKLASKLEDGEIDIYRVLEIGIKVFMSANLKAKQYKTVYNLYYTPAKLFGWGKRQTDKCPRCQKGPAHSLHMFHSCEKLNLLKEGIEKFWLQSLNKEIKITPTLML